MPVLAVCRGSQVLNVARGGDLVQHLPEIVGHDRHRHYRAHDGRSRGDGGERSKLGEILGDRAPVKSSHHQGFGRSARGFGKPPGPRTGRSRRSRTRRTASRSACSGTRGGRGLRALRGARRGGRASTGLAGNREHDLAELVAGLHALVRGARLPSGKTASITGFALPPRRARRRPRSRPSSPSSSRRRQLLPPDPVERRRRVRPARRAADHDASALARAAWSDRCQVASPTCSTTTSAPCPPVASLTASTTSSRAVVDLDVGLDAGRACRRSTT